MRAHATSSLRVLHIGPTPFFADRGCHIRIRGLMLALQRRGVACSLVTYGHGNDVEGIITRRALRIPGYTQLDAGPSPFKYLADLLLLLTTCRAIVGERPDILHGHLHEGALIGWLAQNLVFWRRPPLVFDMQGSLVGELERYSYFRGIGVLRRSFAAAEWIIDRLPARIVCSSSASLRIARDRFGVPGPRLQLIPDGVDPHQQPADRGACRAELGIGSDETLVVYSGSLLPVKGLDALHATIAEVARRNLPVRFLLIGYPTQATAAFLRQRGLERNCQVVGRVAFEQLAGHLTVADIAIEPKSGDSGEASGKVLNYMAAALPVVCFDTPNNREILAETGCYASASTAAGLADRIGELIADPRAARAFGRAGLERARTTYSWAASAATLEKLYRACLDSRAGWHREQGERR